MALMTAIENISAGSGATPQEVWEYATRTLTGLPALPTDWVTAASLKADAIAEIQSGLATSAALQAVDDLVDDLESRLTAARAGYLDKLNVTGTLANTSNADTFKADVTNLDATVSSRLATAGYTATDNAGITAIKAKTDNLPTSPAATGDAMTLTAAYDHAKDDVLTPLGVVDGVVDAIKLKTDNIPANPATAGEYTASLAAIQADVSGIPDAILTKAIVDTLTVEQVLKVLAAVETGITTGGGTDTIVYTGKDGTEIRLTGVDEDGNRSAVIVIPGA